MKTTKTQLRKLRNRLRLLFSPPPKKLPSEWAEESMYLPPNSPMPGRYRNEVLPWQREMMDAFVDAKTTAIVIKGPAQTMGKTQVFLNVLGYFTAFAPTSVFICYPTLQKAKDFARKKLKPTVDATPVLKDKIGETIDGKKRDGVTELFKPFTGGFLALGGARSPSSLRGDSTKIVILDELSGFSKAAGAGDSAKAVAEGDERGEGDPVAMAERRGENFPDAVFCYVSTPLWKGSCRITKKFEESDQRHWHVDCPHCNSGQVLKWEQFEFNREDPTDSRYRCEKCGEAWTDKERISAIRGGRWVAHKPGRLVRGYALNGLYQITGKKRMYRDFYHQFADKYLTARAGGEKTFMEWVTQFLAEAYESEGEVLTPDPIFNRREAYSVEKIPAGVLAVVAAADTQPDREEVELIGVGLGEETWGMGFHRVLHEPGTPEWIAEMDKIRSTKFQHPSGAVLGVSAVFIDAGGHNQKAVYDYVRPRQVEKVFACHGSVRPMAPLISRPRKQGKTGVLLYEVGTAQAKNSIYSRLQLQKPGPGFMHFPSEPCYDQDFFKQLTAEKRVDGKWVKAKGRRNEALDIRVYAMAAFASLGYSEKKMQALADQLKVAEGDKAGEVVKQTSAPKSWPKSRWGGRGISREDLAAMKVAPTTAEKKPAEEKPKPAPPPPPPIRRNPWAGMLMRM